MSSTRLILRASTLLAALLLAGTVQAKPAADCAALATLEIPASALALPTGGVAIESAETRPAGTHHPAYCRVVGRILPVDPAAPAFRFSVGLPDQWNGKAIQRGGGGYNGVLKEPVTRMARAVENGGTAQPVALGYVVFASDGGHQDPSGRFALNDEALLNYSTDQLKKTHDAAMAVVKAHYGKLPRRTYFIGFSEGGRQAMMVSQRFAADYDGVIAGGPVYALVPEELGNVEMFKPFFAPGGAMTAAKMTLLREAVLASCDELDGLKDGLVSHPAACRFDPAALRCPDGTDSGSSCLSDAQIATVNSIGSPVRFTVPMANGVSVYGPYPILKGGTIHFGDERPGATGPGASGTPGLWDFGAILARWFIERDGDADPRAFNAEAHAARIKQVSDMADATSADLDQFRARGGKLILYHGAVDSLVSPDNTEYYHARLKDRYGQAALDSFLRFYIIPGFDHGWGNPYNADFDLLAALDAWVERGEAPRDLVVRDMPAATEAEPYPATVLRSRPLCDYPKYPKYLPGKDVGKSTSFVCVE